MDEIIHLKIPTVDGPHPVMVLTLLEGEPGQHYVSIRWGDTKGPDLVLLLDEVHVIKWDEFKAMALTLAQSITLPRERPNDHDRKADALEAFLPPGSLSK